MMFFRRASELLLTTRAVTAPAAIMFALEYIVPLTSSLYDVVVGPPIHILPFCKSVILLEFDVPEDVIGSMRNASPEAYPGIILIPP